MNKKSYIYFMTNKNNNVLYIGVTNDLARRVYEHKTNLVKGFTKRYNVSSLVYYEIYDDISIAIAREKQLKTWTRDKKNKLLESFNPSWSDLHNSIF